MARGHVKWWNDDDGYGFIIDTKGVDIFVTYRDIQISSSKPYPKLEEGEGVEFEIVAGLRGPMAEHVREPGKPISRSFFSYPTHTAFVKVFRGDSIREIEFEINEFVRDLDIKIVSASMTNKDTEGKISSIVVFEPVS